MLIPILTYRNYHQQVFEESYFIHGILVVCSNLRLWMKVEPCYHQNYL
jgi:hypothetical protein